MKTRLKILFRRVRIVPRCFARIMRIKYELFILRRNLKVLQTRQKVIHEQMSCLAFEGMLADIHVERDGAVIDFDSKENFDREVELQVVNDVVVCDQIKRTRKRIHKCSFELEKLGEVVPHLFVH